MKKNKLSVLLLSLTALLLGSFLVVKLGTRQVLLQLYFYKQEIPGDMQELVAAFTRRYPQIMIETGMVPDSSLAELRKRFISGNAPDLIQLQGYAQVREFAAAGYLLDLSRENVLSRIPLQWLPAGGYNGKQYALPMDFSGIGIFYNRTIFERYALEPPRTLPELQQICRRLQKEAIYPFAGMLRVNWSAGHFLTLLHAGLSESNTANEQWIDAMNAGRAVWADPVHLESLFHILDFYKQNLDPRAAQRRESEQLTLFAGGDAAMLVQGLWAYGKLESMNPELECGFVPFPVSSDPAAAQFYADIDSTFAISAQSTPRKQAAAGKFLNWLSTPEAITLWTNNCRLISTFSQADNSLLPAPYQEFQMHVQEHGTRHWEFCRYPLAVYETAIKNGAQAYLLGQISAEDLLQNIELAWRKTRP